MTNWDIKIVDPVILIFGVAAIITMFYLEKIKGRTLIFYIEIILIWIANGIMAKFIGKEITTALGLDINDITFTLMLIFSAALFAIIFKPLATYLTGRIHSRRLWMWIAYGTTLAVLVMLLFNKGMDNKIIYFLSVALVGFSLSSSSLYYLFSNEQHYYRVNPLGVGFVVAICMAFSSFMGSFIVGINNEVGNETSYYAIIVIAMVLTGFAIALSFIKKENSSLVQSFSEGIVASLKRTSTMTLVLSCLVVYAISLSQQLTHGIFDQMFIAFLMKKENYASSNISSSINTLDSLMYGFVAIVGYFAYRFMKTVGIKFYNLLCGFLAVACVAIQAFAKDGILIMCLNVLSAFFFNQIMYSLFATAIFQNYRRYGVPVTGYFAASIQAGVFTDDFIENMVIKNKVSIFDKYNTINSIIQHYDANQYQSDFDGFNTCLTAVSCVAICLTLISIVILYFRADNLFVEYLDLKQALINQKTNLKKSIADRAKTPIDFSK